ncbi:MAG: glycosyltransferase [Acetatifactor sp.]
MNKPYIVIPSLNPGDRLLPLVEELKKQGFEHIIIVNDGSCEECLPVFEALEEKGGCAVLHHHVNQGKGRALKTAFNYYLGVCTREDSGVITMDSDGQHLVADVEKCALALQKEQDKLILGCRNFASDEVPWKSSFGNRITRTVLKFFCGISVTDSQTGLRGYSTELVRRFMRTKGEGFEYETYMLLDAAEAGISFREVEIQTVYLDGNRETHFRPVADSLRIYAGFLKYIFSSLSSFLIDIFLFWLLQRLFARNIGENAAIWIATVGARIVSSLYNFSMNRTVVFKSNADTGKALIKYYCLCAVQMCLSGGGVTLLFRLTDINATVLKIIVDSILFLCSYQIQRCWVFKKKKQTFGRR